MKFPGFLLGVVLSLGLACNSRSHAPMDAALAQSLQLIVVQAADWNYPKGTLYVFERKTTRSPWQSVMTPFPVMMGLNGLGWGLGLEDFRKGRSPVKQEGDKRSPAGIFSLTSVFGYRPPDEAGVLYMPYVQVGPETRCIEDAGSTYYNKIVQESEVNPDWEGADEMLRPDNLYSWGVFVGHNTPGPEAGAGSCIFLHVWRGPDQGTLGCTAMEYHKMEELVYWLNRSKQPLLVQLPKVAYEQNQTAWNLPALD